MNPLFHLNMQVIMGNPSTIYKEPQKVVTLIKGSTAAKIVTHLLEHGPTRSEDIRQMFNLRRSTGAYIVSHTEEGTVICTRLSSRHSVYSINPELTADNFHIVEQRKRND